MEPKAAFRAWSRILTGYHPNLSVEITCECPLGSLSRLLRLRRCASGRRCPAAAGGRERPGLIDGMLLSWCTNAGRSIFRSSGVSRSSDFDKLEVLLLPQLTCRWAIHTQPGISAVRPLFPAGQHAEAADRGVD